MLFKEFAPPKKNLAPTPEQSRIKALQTKVELDRQQLQAEKDRQRRAKDAEKLKKINLVR